MNYATFETWKELLDAIAAGYTIWYHAPMDVNPMLVGVVVRRDGKIRVTPCYSDADPFTADQKHLDRFRKVGR